jgi:DNA polymerase I
MKITRLVSVDTETTGTNPWQGDKPFAVSMCNEEGDTWYCQWPVDPFTREPIPDQKDLGFVRRIMEDPETTKIFHNAKFDVRMLDRAYGIQIAGNLHDTMIAARIVNSLEEKAGLKPLSDKYLGYPQDDQSRLQKACTAARNTARRINKSEAKKGNPEIKLGEDVHHDYWLPKFVDPSNTLCEEYARQDAERTMGLWMLYEPWIAKLNVEHIYEMEMRLWDIVYEMENRGVRVSIQKIRKELEHNRQLVNKSYAVMAELAGHDFNPKSTDELRRIVYKRPDVRVKRLTVGGKAATDWKSLIDYKNDQFVRALFDFRAANKGIEFFETYLRLAVVDPLSKNSNWMVLHPTFNQANARTPRFSCQEPNLQQVGKRQSPTGAEPPKARLPFGPRAGYNLYLIDYEQLELRILAGFAQEPLLLQAIKDGRDMHSEVANRAWGGQHNPAAIINAEDTLGLHHGAPPNDAIAEVWADLGVKPHDKNLMDPDFVGSIAYRWLEKFDFEVVTAEASIGSKSARDRAKNVMYAKMYGGGPNAVMEFLFCTYDEARSFLRSIDRAFPDMQKYANRLAVESGRVGYLHTVYGRRLRIEEGFEYKAVSYMVQGSAADLLKFKMVEVSDYLRSTGLDAWMVLTIHDELVFEIRKEHAYNFVLKRIQQIMEDHGGKFQVDLPTELSYAPVSWHHKKKLVV